MADTLISLLRNKDTDYFTYLSKEAKDIADHIESYSPSDFELSQRLSTFLPDVYQLLSPQVEQMLYPVVTMRRLREQLRKMPENSNGKCSEIPKKYCGFCSISDSDSDVNFLCATCISANRGTSDHSLASLAVNEINEENEAVAFLKNTDTSIADEILEKYTNIHLKTLNHMEAHLEILLDFVMSIRKSLPDEDKCNIKEFIEKLSPKHVEKICEFLNKKVEVNSNADLLEELNKEDMATSSWIYYVISAFKRDQIRKL